VRRTTYDEHIESELLHWRAASLKIEPMLDFERLERITRSTRAAVLYPLRRLDERIEQWFADVESISPSFARLHRWVVMSLERGGLDAVPVILLAFTELVLLFLAILYGPDLARVLWDAIPSGRPRQIICTTAVIGIGVFLYWLRDKKRLFYGSGEVLFAIYVSWQATGTLMQNGLAQWVALMSALYVFVRGSDNLMAGYRQRTSQTILPNPPSQSEH
jgi:hypothetical protein